MFILIDMRPWAEDWTEKGNFFSVDFLHALFRNHPTDVFLLWTTGEKNLPEDMLFDEYQNTRILHTEIDSNNIITYIDWFDAVEIDDLVETDAMKQGIMPWLEKIEIAFFATPRPWKVEENCFSVMMVNGLSALHQNLSEKYLQKKYFQKALEKANMVVVPSLFSLQECQYVFGTETDRFFLSSTGLLKELIPTTSEENSFWKDLPEKFFFVKVEDETSAMIVIKAFELFKTRFPETTWKLVMEEREKGSLHFLYHHGKKVHILAPLLPEHHRTVLSKTSVFIDASKTDSVGHALLQAMRLEIPTIASSFGALHEVSGGASLFFDPTKATDLYAQMKKIVEDSTLQKDLKKKGKDRSWNARFFLDDIAMAVLDEAKKRKG